MYDDGPYTVTSSRKYELTWGRTDPQVGSEEPGGFQGLSDSADETFSYLPIQWLSQILRILDKFVSHSASWRDHYVVRLTF